jgi:hypothetical protein
MSAAERAADDSSLSWSGFHFEVSANDSRPIVHCSQSQSEFFFRDFWKRQSVIPHCQNQFLFAQTKRDDDLLRLAMFESVVDRFLCDVVKVPAHRGINPEPFDFANEAAGDMAKLIHLLNQVLQSADQFLAFQLDGG